MFSPLNLSLNIAQKVFLWMPTKLFLIKCCRGVWGKIFSIFLLKIIFESGNLTPLSVMKQFFKGFPCCSNYKCSYFKQTCHSPVQIVCPNFCGIWSRIRLRVVKILFLTHRQLSHTISRREYCVCDSIVSADIQNLPEGFHKKKEGFTLINSGG